MRFPAQESRSPRALTASITILSLLAAAWVLQTSPAPPQLPPPFQTPSAANAPTVVARPEGAEFRLPKGFQVELYAEGFERPRVMILGPGKEVLVTDTIQKGTITALVDANRDGKVDKKVTVLEGSDRPYGIALWKDYLYVAEPASLKRYKYDAANMKAVTPGEEVVSLEGQGTGHPQRVVLFDRKGEKMYLSVASRSNVDVGEDPRRATILRFTPDGKEQEVYASGLRSLTGLALYPGTDTLWATVQERDLLGDDLVPDYFTTIRQGGFYGWPYSYIGANEDPRNKGKAPAGLIEKTIVPDVILGAHVAVLGVQFYTGKMFPAEYQGGAFLAQHGSWNRSLRVGYNLAFIPFKGGKAAGPPREFLSGFMLAPDKKEVWGRPVGLLQLEDGSLLFSDDGGKKIWRVTYKG
jgi:glucose/arabinose dehydrogenase